MKLLSQIHSYILSLSSYYTSLVALALVMGAHAVAYVPITIASYVLLLLTLYVNYREARAISSYLNPYHDDHIVSQDNNYSSKKSYSSHHSDLQENNYNNSSQYKSPEYGPVSRKLRYTVQSFILLGTIVFLYLAGMEVLKLRSTTIPTLRLCANYSQQCSYPRILFYSVPVIFSCIKAISSTYRVAREYTERKTYTGEVIVRGRGFGRKSPVPSNFGFALIGLFMALVPFSFDIPYFIGLVVYLCTLVRSHVKLYDSKRNGLLSSTCLLAAVSLFVGVYGFNKAVLKLEGNFEKLLGVC